MNFLPKDPWILIGSISSVLTIVSFVLFLIERHRRKKDQSFMVGFLMAARSTSQGQFQAGEEWRHDLDKKPEGYTIGYANSSINAWKAHLVEINKAIKRLDNERKEKAQ